MNQHARFQQRAINSRPAVRHVAHLMLEKGKVVEMPVQYISPTAAEAVLYIDNGDLFIWDHTSDRVVRKRYEVKHRPLDFGGASNWPFFPEGVLVSNVAAVDRAGGSVVAYITLSRDMKRAAVIYGSTRESWRKTVTSAGNTGNDELNYICTLIDVVFMPTEELDL
jgi:hypothetical protein